MILGTDLGYDYNNEIGALCNGSTVIVIGEAVGDYVPVTVTTQAQGSWNRHLYMKQKAIYGTTVSVLGGRAISGDEFLKVAESME